MSDTKQLTIAETGSPALTRSREEAYAIARARVFDPHSKNTKRAYQQAYARWCAYCDAHNLPWAPIEPKELVTYCEELSKTLAPNTVRLHLSALCSLDAATRISATNPTPQSLREHFVVARWEQSWEREHPRAPRRKAAALGLSELEQLLAAAAEPPKNAARAAHVLQYARDRCLILFGATGAFRGAELCDLLLSDIEPTERGLRVRVRHSKTDQAGEGKTTGLMPQGKRALCPVDAFMMWRAARGDAPGPLFVGVSRSAQLELGRKLTERHVTRLISDYAKRAGLQLQISTHSLRATLATLAMSKGKSIDRVMAHGRWRSADVAIGYMQQAQLFDDNVTAGLFE